MSALCVLCQGLSIPPPPRLLASRLTPAERCASASAFEEATGYEQTEVVEFECGRRALLERVGQKRAEL